LGRAKLSNTGKFLYGKIKSSFISGLFNMVDPLCMNIADFTSPNNPKLVNLETMKIIQKFKRWGRVNFSNNDKFLFACNTENHTKDMDDKDTNLNNTKLINLEKIKIVRTFKGYGASKFDKQGELAIISLSESEYDFSDDNLAELIDTQSGICLKAIDNISLYESKFSSNSKFLKLKFNDGSIKIINIKCNFTVLTQKENDGENCGLTGNFAWTQDKKNKVKIVRLSDEIKPFREKLLDQYKHANIKLEDADKISPWLNKNWLNKNNFSDVRIKTLS